MTAARHTPRELRAHALRCREAAKTATDPDIVKALLQLADDLEAEAEDRERDLKHD